MLHECFKHVSVCCFTSGNYLILSKQLQSKTSTYFNKKKQVIVVLLFNFYSIKLMIEKKENTINYARNMYRLTLCMVSCNAGNGNRGSELWKLYNFGLFQPLKIFTQNPQIFVGLETDCPLPLASYIHPLYIKRSFRVYRMAHIIISQINRPIRAHAARCHRTLFLKKEGWEIKYVLIVFCEGLLWEVWQNFRY